MSENEAAIKLMEEYMVEEAKTTLVKGELKQAFIDFQLARSADEFVHCAIKYQKAYLACLNADVPVDALRNMQDNWGKLLVAGHFRRTP